MDDPLSSSGPDVISSGEVQYDAAGNAFVVQLMPDGTTRRVDLGYSKPGDSGWKTTDIIGLTFNPATNTYAYDGTIITNNEARQILASEQNKPRQPSYSYSVSQSYQDPAALALEARGLDQRAYEFDQSQALAKEKWLFEKQNAIERLQLERESLATTQANNARSFYLEQQKFSFMKDQFAFESSLALRQEARATEAQMFSQQATVAGIQLEMASITQQANNLQAQLNQEVALFNAGKAADVSMFNIDQQTKVAQFNAEMAFNVEQANVQNERLRQQQLIDVASRISDAAADPGDRGALASLILANSGFGAPDAALAGADLRTGDSLVPLEAMLRQREDILASDPNPFEFTPITAGQATFTPASAQTVQKPDFSGVTVPKVNTTPFDASSVPTAAPRTTTGGGGFDAANQNYIATGQTLAGNEQFVNSETGAPLTAEQRAQMPDFVIQDLIAKGYLPAAAEGGQMPGAYLGDEKGAELHMPGFDAMGNRIQQVIPADMTQRLLGMWGNRGGASIQPVPNTPFQMPNFGGQMPQRPNVDIQAMLAQLPPELIAMMQRFKDVQQPDLHLDPDTAQAQQPTWGGGDQNLNPRSNGGQRKRPQTPAQTTTPTNTVQSAIPGNSQMAMQPYDTHKMPVAPPGMEKGGIVSGAYIGSDDGSAVHIPIPGTDMTIIMPAKKGKKAGGMQHMAEGGLYQEQGKSMYEGLLSDTDRSRATAFLDEASRRAAMGTPFNINRLPTPVFASTPGMSPYVTRLLASLNAIKRGIPAGYFEEQANMLRPTAYAEGVIGRTR